MAEAQQEIGAESGEIACPECMERMAANGELRSELAQANRMLEQAEIRKAGLEHTISSLSYKLEELKRDKDAEAKEHELWDTVLDLFNLWCHVAGDAEGRGKPKGARLSGERFWLAVGFLKREGLARCQRAIVGRCASHFHRTLPSGKEIHYCEWERIFGDKGKGNTARLNFESACNSAPADWRVRVEAFGFKASGEGPSEV